MIPAPPRSIGGRAATVNLGTIAGAWPHNITVHVTVVQGRPTYSATVTVLPKGAEG